MRQVNRVRAVILNLIQDPEVWIPDRVRNDAKQQGYVALISAIVISILLLTITFTLSFTGFFSRFNVLDAEYKKVSQGLAEACIDNAILKLVSDKNYTLTAADQDIPVGSETCDIVSLHPSPPRTGSIRIKTQGVHNETYTNLNVVIAPGFNITSWEECPNLTSSDTSC